MPIQTLGQNDFLKLLVTQMTSQDPLNPQKDTEFIAQMAQFSALEQAKTMQQDISGMASGEQSGQAVSLLGHDVQVLDAKGKTILGTVNAVTIEAGTPKITVNGKSYTLDQVMAVSPAVNPNTK
ncbi:MAG: flagellar hook capping protein [Verrucomicrobiales bacterium]|jgi:flagellar basal-body rod modification protein FlgD|nr:flagellar hook capping protein [Verrucomicrobiales bacterium]